MFGRKILLLGGVFLAGVGVMFYQAVDIKANYTKVNAQITSVEVDCYVQNGKRKIVEKKTDDLAYMDCALAPIAAEAGVVHVVGTTGLSEQDITALDRISTDGRMIRAGNMSLGVNLLTTLTEKVAKALGPEYDIEIVEAHHRHKVDAPSGTALMLGEAAATGRGIDLAASADRGRDGITGARAAGAIGFSAIRGGDIIGEHDVIFAGPGERIILRHVASDRALFARGAIRAAIWGQDQAPGTYDMIDVLGLK